MSITVTYSTRRVEIWQWYWRQWRRRLWKTHAVTFVAVTIPASLWVYDGLPTGPTQFALIGAIGIAPLLGFAAYPMLAFKPQPRLLMVDTRGIETTIAEKTKSTPWSEVATVNDEGHVIVIQLHNLNAYLVPSRAFASAAERLKFLDFATAQIGQAA